MNKDLNEHFQLKLKAIVRSYVLMGYLLLASGFFVHSQFFESIEVLKVVEGNNTDNALFSAKSPTNKQLAYIRAERFEGPQNGVFTINQDNIRYTSHSTEEGIPNNLSKIRFSFLRPDKKTLIDGSVLRVTINDIDGPNNEALVTKCSFNVRYTGTAAKTNLKIVNKPPYLRAEGTVDENDGFTSRVMYEFVDAAVIEFENYANNGYLKDFDWNSNNFPISKPSLISCSNDIQINKTLNLTLGIELVHNKGEIMIRLKPIYFDLDKYEIKKEVEPELQKVFLLLKNFPELKIELRSHTDSRAEDNYNLVLSENRAQATLNWFLKYGIEPQRLTAKGFGETKLVNGCSNGIPCTDEEHALNRRTEFVIVNPEVFDLKSSNNPIR